MEVLKHGKNYSSLVCPTCECEFGYTGGDITKLNARDTYNEKLLELTKAFIRCPECGSIIELRSNIHTVEQEVK